MFLYNTHRRGKSSLLLLCKNCRAKARYRDPETYRPCCECGTELPVAEIREKGPLCDRCYRERRRKDPRTHGTCGACGTKAPLRRGHCKRCYDKMRYNDPSTHEICKRCGTMAPVKKRTEKGPLCPSCYSKMRRRNLPRN